MKVKIDGRQVDVLDAGCKDRPCFSLGFDKGSFAPGRGYTSYHTDSKGRRVERAVCGTRHFRGCPTNSVCAKCKTCSVNAPQSPCDRFGCDGTTKAREEEKTDG